MHVLRQKSVRAARTCVRPPAAGALPNACSSSCSWPPPPAAAAAAALRGKDGTVSVRCEAVAAAVGFTMPAASCTAATHIMLTRSTH